MNRRAILSIVATTSALWFGSALAQQKEVNFGIIATESSANLKTAWTPLLEDMEKATGLKIKPFFSTDYGGVIEGMRFNKVQVAWHGNKSAMEAVDRAEGEVFARVTQSDGAQGYYSLMLVHRDSPLKTLDDVIKNRQSLTLGYGDPNSTSGTLVPGYYAFAQNKVDPLKDFRRVMRASHEVNILAVANKQVDVSTVASDGLERMKIKLPAKHAEIREVWRSPLIANDPIVWRKDLDTDVKKRVRDFLLGYGKDAREKENLRVLTWGGFVASDNNQLLPIRQLELVRQRLKVESDTAMEAADREKKLKEIDARLADLGKQVAAAR